MRDRLERILKIACLALAVVLAWRVMLIALHFNPLSGVTIPEVPTLSADTNAPAKAPATSGPMPEHLVRNGTNLPPRGSEKTNAASRLAGTNSAPGGTNVFVSQMHGTNLVVPTNSLSAAATNPAARGALPRNEANAMARIATNSTSNAVVRLAERTVGTNGTINSNLVRIGPAQTHASARSPRSEIAMMSPGGFPRGGPVRAPELAPEAKARVFRIYDSEILGPVMHPLPMALLGIAGDYAIIRAPSGQTDMVKEGATIGEIKLLKIGTNRVLVEEAGEKKELTIFEGYGGQSLLPKPERNQ